RRAVCRSASDHARSLNMRVGEDDPAAPGRDTPGRWSRGRRGPDADLEAVQASNQCDSDQPDPGRAVRTGFARARPPNGLWHLLLHASPRLSLRRTLPLPLISIVSRTCRWVAAVAPDTASSPTRTLAEHSTPTPRRI